MTDAAWINDNGTAFNRFGITSFTDRMLGLNIDGVSVNIGVHRGVGSQLMKEAPWLQVVHSFNHRVGLALEDVFTTIHFKNM